MSVEIRSVTEGHCNCGTVLTADTPSTCTHRWVTDWGEIEHPNPRPDRGEVGHLLITDAGWFHDLCHWGPALFPDGRVYRATDGARRFLNLQYGQERWTWEMFDAHWADGHPVPMLIGRWPD